MLVFQKNETAAMLVYQTNPVVVDRTLFLCKKSTGYFSPIVSESAICVIFLVVWEILGFGIRNTGQGFRNPSSTDKQCGI